MTTWARRALLGGLALVLGACTLDLDVNVELSEDGSGAVEVVAALDAEALARVGGDLEAVLALDDLRAEGWSVDGPAPAPDNSTTVRLRQPFADPAAAAEVFEDLSGAGGPFEGLAVSRDRSPLTTRWRFEGTVDLAGGVRVPAGSAPAVDGEPLAATLEQLEAQLGESLERLLRLRVRVRLPGDVESNATTRADNGAVWRIGFGDGPVELSATGSEPRTGVVAAAVLGGLALLVGLVALLIRLAGRVTGGPSGPGAVRSSGRAGP